jgi:hypothetical protein
LNDRKPRRYFHRNRDTTRPLRFRQLSETTIRCQHDVRSGTLSDDVLKAVIQSITPTTTHARGQETPGGAGRSFIELSDRHALIQWIRSEGAMKPTKDYPKLPPVILRKTGRS